MNTFYFNEKSEQIETEKPNNNFTEIKTNKSYEEFIEDFGNARDARNSIIDSIEWAK